MGDIEAPPTIPPTFSSNSDPEEARLEAREYSRYLLAKSYFDCREFDRCANVFLPQTAGREPLSQRSANATPRATPKSGKGKGKNFGSSPTSRISSSGSDLPLLSQKALFMSLYARLLSGEKRKDEESEMILGPSDVGTTVNKELVVLARTLETWFATRASKGQDGSNQGWLEYLYGVVLSKGKTENDAKRWLIRSVHICPFNWSAWLELGDLIGNVEEVSCIARSSGRIDSDWIDLVAESASRAPTESHERHIQCVRQSGALSINRYYSPRLVGAGKLLPRKSISKDPKGVDVLSFQR